MRLPVNYRARLGFGVIIIAVWQNTALAAPDTSQWLCQLCPFQTGTQTSVTAGISTVSEDAARFGHSTGFDKQGAYALFASEGKVNTKAHAYAWRLTDLGIDSRTAELRLSKPGTYDVKLSYDAFPSRSFDTTATVFQSPDAGYLALPSPWLRSSLTTGLADLPNSLRPIKIESERDIYRLSTSYQTSPSMHLFSDYRRQEQRGINLTSGAFFTNASLLPAPIDHTTNEIDLGIRLQNASSYAELSFYGSYFDNDNATLVWDNPFTAFPGAEAGDLARPPDNNFQQLSIRGSHRFGRHTHLSGSAAIGRGEQDASFPGYTINANLISTALPRRHLDGKVNTTNLHLALNSNPTSKLDLNFSYRYDERDNRSARSTWSGVILDSLFSGTPETNLLYSSKRSRFLSRARLKLHPDLKLSAGYEHNQTDREYQEVAEQIENIGWGGLSWQPLDYFELKLKTGTAKREIDRYNQIFASEFGQNPLFRKFNLAHRYRIFGEVSVHASIPHKPVSLTATAIYADDDYSQSRIGLRRAEELQVSLDATWTWSQLGMAYFNIGREENSSQQSGGANPAGPSWQATQDHTFDNYGIGVRLTNILPNTDAIVDYTRAVGIGEIHSGTTTLPARPFPDLKSELDTLQLRVLYRPSGRYEIEMHLRYERFLTKDWALEGVAPDTIASILTMGAEPYDYNILQFGLQFKYHLNRE